MSLNLENSCTKSIELTRYQGFPGGSGGKESTCNAGDLSSVPGSGRSSGEGNGYPLQYSCLENPMDRGAWWATIHRVANSGARLPWLSMYTWLIIFHGKCHKKRNQRIILKKIFLLEIWWIVAIWVGVQITSIRRQRGWSDYWSPCRLLSPPRLSDPHVLQAKAGFGERMYREFLRMWVMERTTRVELEATHFQVSDVGCGRAINIWVWVWGKSWESLGGLSGL